LNPSRAYAYMMNSSGIQQVFLYTGYNYFYVILH